MPKIFSLLTLCALSLTTLSACGTPSRVDPTIGQFWQRTNVSEAAYMQGPKAQQMLNKSIASCVAELKEMEKLGMIKEAIPANVHTGQILATDEQRLMTFDEPERDKNLFAEHGNYHDFETCMIFKGWERVKYVPFDVAHEARKNYLIAHVDYEYKTNEEWERHYAMERESGDHSDYNQ